MLKKNKHPIIPHKTDPSYCESCFAELDYRSECPECQVQTDIFKTKVKGDKSNPNFSKLFKPEEEGITWEYVPSKYKDTK